MEAYLAPTRAAALVSFLSPSEVGTGFSRLHKQININQNKLPAFHSPRSPGNCAAFSENVKMLILKSIFLIEKCSKEVVQETLESQGPCMSWGFLAL